MSPSKPWKRQCRGTRADGERCTRWAIVGGDVCPKHGAGAPQVKSAAARRFAVVRAEDECRRLSVPVDIDASDALLLAVRKAAGRVVWSEGWLDEIDGPPVQEIHVAGGGTNVGEHVLHSVHQGWLDRLVTYSAAAMRAGVEERRVQAEERFAMSVARGFERLLASPVLALSWELREAGRAEAAKILLELDGPVAA